MLVPFCALGACHSAGLRCHLVMNRAWLIDAIVRQTTVLVAQLATAAGQRNPVGHVAEQIFLDLVRALEEAGVGQKIIADMFGMALRTYHARVRRLRESSTDRGRTLWIAVLEHLQQQQRATRAEVLHRFRRDDAAIVRSVLKDLVNEGLLYRSGRGDATTYRVADAEDVRRSSDVEVAASHLWLAIFHKPGITRDELVRAAGMSDAMVDSALAHLLRADRVRAEGDTYVAQEVLIAYEDEAGWEAALFDHFQAVVTAITTKLQHGHRARHRDVIGGSTYRFDVWSGHPLENEVLGLLGRVRDMASDLRARVDAHNQALAAPRHAKRVVFYVGQTVPIDDMEEGAST